MFPFLKLLLVSATNIVHLFWKVGLIYFQKKSIEHKNMTIVRLMIRYIRNNPASNTKKSKSNLSCKQYVFFSHTCTLAQNNKKNIN